MRLTKSLLLVALITALAMPAWAWQYVINQTTLNGAITATQTTLVLTSASAKTGTTFGAPTAGQCLFIDGELMRIVSVASTTATITRSLAGAAAHANAAVIWTVSCAAFKTVDPPTLNNGVVAAGNLCSTQPAPWINTSNGNIWWCGQTAGSGTLNTWYGTNYKPLTYGSVRINMP